MMRAVLTLDAAHTALAAVVREQLRAAYDRGWTDSTAGTNGLADPGAKESFAAVMTAAHDYGQAISLVWREQLTASKRGDQP